MLQPLDFRAKVCYAISILKEKHKMTNQTCYVAQRQIDTEVIEILWECVNEEQADDECDRINSSLPLAGIPGEYHAFVIG
jgi:hypothetical protein